MTNPGGEVPSPGAFPGVARALLGEDWAKKTEEQRAIWAKEEQEQARQELRTARINAAYGWITRILWTAIAMSTAAGIDVLIWRSIP
jgi:hypothetical protein